MRRSIMLCGLLALVLGAGVPFAASAQTAKPESKSAKDIKDAKPSGTVEITSEQIALIIGGSSGRGVLTFQGKQYPFTFKGGGSVGVGASKTAATGDVYFLNRTEDFPGTYTAVAAGAVIGVGVGRSTWENGKGVLLVLRSKSEGVQLSLGAAGATVEFVK